MNVFYGRPISRVGLEELARLYSVRNSEIVRYSGFLISAAMSDIAYSRTHDVSDPRVAGKV